MDDGRQLCAAFLEKLHEQLDRTTHLVSLAPLDRLEWAPPISGAWPVSVLLGHLYHKHQLFTYLKLMGVEVGSGDLYRFRG